jgi:hypothetical protein
MGKQRMVETGHGTGDNKPSNENLCESCSVAARCWLFYVFTYNLFNAAVTIAGHLAECSDS